MNLYEDVQFKKKKRQIWIWCKICENGNLSPLYKIPDHFDSYWNDWISDMISREKVTILQGGNFVWMRMMWIRMKMWDLKKPPTNSNSLRNLLPSSKISDYVHSSWKAWISNPISWKTLWGGDFVQVQTFFRKMNLYENVWLKKRRIRNRCEICENVTLSALCKIPDNVIPIENTGFLTWSHEKI